MGTTRYVYSTLRTAGILSHACYYATTNFNFFNLKGCGTVVKEAPPAAARETLLIVAAKLKSTAQCGTVNVPPLSDRPK